MKVYVITRGNYSDYEICAVSLDKNNAEKLARLYSGMWDAEVEEYETDQYVPFLFNKPAIKVHFYPQGEVAAWAIDPGEAVEGYIQVNEYFNGDIDITFDIYADNKERAIKIAADRRAEYIARKQGI